ncbi:hypothetical protein A2U01_0037867, partial [Trifolium medium]|nr:hypothetical protein [Trifolium medium]
PAEPEFAVNVVVLAMNSLALTKPLFPLYFLAFSLVSLPEETQLVVSFFPWLFG